MYFAFLISYSWVDICSSLPPPPQPHNTRSCLSAVCVRISRLFYGPEHPCGVLRYLGYSWQTLTRVLPTHTTENRQNPWSKTEEAVNSDKATLTTKVTGCPAKLCRHLKDNLFSRLFPGLNGVTVSHSQCSTLLELFNNLIFTNSVDNGLMVSSCTHKYNRISPRLRRI